MNSAWPVYIFTQWLLGVCSGLSLFSGIEAEKIQFVVAHLVVDNGLRGKTMSVPLLSYHRKLIER